MAWEGTKEALKQSGSRYKEWEELELDLVSAEVVSKLIQISFLGYHMLHIYIAKSMSDNVSKSL